MAKTRSKVSGLSSVSCSRAASLKRWAWLLSFMEFEPWVRVACKRFGNGQDYIAKPIDDCHAPGQGTGLCAHREELPMRALILAALAVLAFATTADARSRGGHYVGGHGSSHRGGHYVSATGSHHYRHRR